MPGTSSPIWNTTMAGDGVGLFGKGTGEDKVKLFQLHKIMGVGTGEQEGGRLPLPSLP